MIARGQTLVIPELAAHLRLSSSEFVVDYVTGGGMGQCLRIAAGGKHFALKIIGSDLILKESFWQRYLREIRIWATVSACEGVVECLCAVQVNGLPAVCSPWMARGSLRNQLRDHSPQFFFDTMSRVVGTLAWAYRTREIIHRDLKPDNILLDQNNIAYVSDWGLAKAIASADATPKQESRRNASGGADLTQAGRAPFTPAYASPEQIAESPEVDHRSDIYSLGVLMYEWEAGQIPFLGNSDQIQLGHLFESPRKLGGVLKRTKFGVEKLIAACLEKSPANRPNDYQQLERALAEAGARRGVTVRKYTPGLRYDMPLVGAGEFARHIASTKTAIRSTDGKYAIVAQEHVDKFIQEAQILMSTNAYAEARKIWESAFQADLTEACPDHYFSQLVCVNLASCMTAMGEPRAAAIVLKAMCRAEHKPDAYYVNLSLAQIRLHQFRRAMQTAKEGLRAYPNDPGLIGNLLIAQTQLNLFDAASETARIRLAQTRDTNSLLEVSSLHAQYADSITLSDWPLAVKNFEHARDLLKEAVALNPRDLRLRIQLCNVLQRMGAYARCGDQISTVMEWKLHLSDRLYLIYVQAYCLDRMGVHKESAALCEHWLNWIDKQGPQVRVSDISRVRLQRVRAITIFDGLLDIPENAYITEYPEEVWFLHRITYNQDLREARDFYYSAHLFERMDKFDDAQVELATGAFLYPDYWRFACAEARLMRHAQRKYEALYAAQAATRFAPWRRETWQSLACCLHDLGRYEEAQDAENRAAEVRETRRQITARVEADQFLVD